MVAKNVLRVARKIGLLRIAPSLDGKGWGGVDWETGTLLAETPPPPSPSRGEVAKALRI